MAWAGCRWGGMTNCSCACITDQAGGPDALSQLSARMRAAEAAQVRSATELEDQQRLLLALTSAVQKAGQDAEALRAGRSKQEELNR
jgi:hypothetical protein